MGRGFAAGVLCGLVVAALGLIAGSLALGDLPSPAAPGGAQLEVGTVPDAAPEPEPGLAPASETPPPAPQASPAEAAAPAEPAPTIDAAPGAPAPTQAPSLPAPSQGPEGALAPRPAGGDPDAPPDGVGRTVPILPAAPEAEADAPAPPGQGPGGT